EQIKDGANAQFLAKGANMLHGRVVRRSEHKTDADLIDALGNLLWSEVKVHSQRFKNVGAAAFVTDGSIAVFGNFGPGSGRNEGCGGGDVKSADIVLGIAAGAASIDQ